MVINMRKLAVVHAQLGDPANVNPDVRLFSEMPGFKTKYVGYIEDKWSNAPHYVHTEIRKLLPDFIADLVVRRPYSPVSFVNLKGVEKALESVDIINCAELYSFISYQCVKFAKKMNKRVVISVWETLPMLPINFLPPYSLNVRATRSYANVFIAHTQRAVNYLKALSVPDEKIKLIYPSINLERFSPMKKRDGNRFRVLFVGRFDQEKGLPLLLSAFSQLYEEDPSIELWIRAKRRTGQTEQLAYKFAQKYPIKFLGFMDYDKLPKLYNQCDVLCLPSIDKYKWGLKVWEEQFGLVLMEAMACGLPIIATKCGAIPEVVGFKNLIIRQGSFEDIYCALKKIKEDKDYCENVSKLNRARAEKLFDIKKKRRIIGEILHKLMD